MSEISQGRQRQANRQNPVDGLLGITYFSFSMPFEVQFHRKKLAARQ
jgi:hypothetical protein